MKRSAGLAIFTLAAAASVANAADLRPLFDAIRQVETGGLRDPSRAIGDNGASIGPYQISRAYHKDSRVPGRYEQVRDRAYAERVMLGYWRRHAPAELARGNWEALARIHNGGPAGHRKAATVGYWNRVARAMK